VYNIKLELYSVSLQVACYDLGYYDSFSNLS